MSLAKELDFPNDSLSVGAPAMRLEHTAMPTIDGYRFDQASSVCLYCHSAFSRDSGVNGADEWPVNGLQQSPRLWTDCSPPHLGRYKLGAMSGITPSPRAPYRHNPTSEDMRMYVKRWSTIPQPNRGRSSLPQASALQGVAANWTGTLLFCPPTMNCR